MGNSLNSGSVWGRKNLVGGLTNASAPWSSSQWEGIIRGSSKLPSALSLIIDFSGSLSVSSFSFITRNSTCCVEVKEFLLIKRKCFYSEYKCVLNPIQAMLNEMQEIGMQNEMLPWHRLKSAWRTVGQCSVFNLCWCNCLSALFTKSDRSLTLFGIKVRKLFYGVVTGKVYKDPRWIIDHSYELYYKVFCGTQSAK